MRKRVAWRLDGGGFQEERARLGTVECAYNLRHMRQDCEFTTCLGYQRDPASGRRTERRKAESEGKGKKEG